MHQFEFVCIHIAKGSDSLKVGYLITDYYNCDISHCLLEYVLITENYQAVN